MQINIDQLAQLIAIAENANIAELEVSDNQQTIRVTCQLPACHHSQHHSSHSHHFNHQTHHSHSQADSNSNAQMAVSPVLFTKSTKPVETQNPSSEQNTDNQTNNQSSGNTVTSPMLGTFYRKSSPDTPAFVEENSKVNIGDTLCIIEAMKIMHEVKAEQAGVVKQILVKDGEMVEYGQSLFVIE